MVDLGSWVGREYARRRITGPGIAAFLVATTLAPFAYGAGKHASVLKSEPPIVEPHRVEGSSGSSGRSWEDAMVQTASGYLWKEAERLGKEAPYSEILSGFCRPAKVKLCNEPEDGTVCMMFMKKKDEQRDGKDVYGVVVRIHTPSGASALGGGFGVRVDEPMRLAPDKGTAEKWVEGGKGTPSWVRDPASNVFVLYAQEGDPVRSVSDGGKRVKVAGIPGVPFDVRRVAYQLDFFGNRTGSQLGTTDWAGGEVESVGGSDTAYLGGRDRDMVVRLADLLRQVKRQRGDTVVGDYEAMGF